jgi:hypothetical protein
VSAAVALVGGTVIVMVLEWVQDGRRRLVVLVLVFRAEEPVVSMVVWAWEGWVLVLLMVEFWTGQEVSFLSQCKCEIKVIDGFRVCGYLFISPPLGVFARVSVMSLFDRMLGTNWCRVFELFTSHPPCSFISYLSTGSGFFARILFSWLGFFVFIFGLFMLFLPVALSCGL